MTAIRLARLPEQTETYGRVFDRLTLVVGERHLRRAVEMVPDWWGIRVARVESGELQFSDLKVAINNPSLDARFVAMLLWRDEALDLLQEVGHTKGVQSKCKAEIYDLLVDLISLDELRDRVRARLRQRVDWRSASTRLSCGG